MTAAEQLSPLPGSLAVLKVCPAVIEACEQFALSRIGMSEALYRVRGEASKAKMVDDIVTGSVAEFAVYQYLINKGLECTKPDLSIHQNGQKSFSADLKSGNYLIHVKSQSKDSASKYGDSWLFQIEDKALTLPSENGYLLMCIVDGDTVDIKGAAWIIDILEADAVSRPKVGKYALWKKAIYLSDLITKNINIRRF
jgi:hypothetical protein